MRLRSKARPQTAPRLAFAALIAVLTLLVACDKGGKGNAAGSAGGAPGQSARAPVTPPATKAATPKPSTTSADTAQKYLDLWRQQQYGAMYDLLTTPARQAISRDKFVARYSGIADEATITAVTPTFTPPADKQADQVQFSVTYKTSLFGDVNEDLAMTLQREADGWRVQWTPSLIFKDLGQTNLVHTFVDVPRRGAILARDGTPLAITDDVSVVGTSRALMTNTGVVKDQQAAINAIAQKLGIGADEVQKKVLDSSTPEDYFIALKTLPYDAAAADLNAIQALPGVVVQNQPERVYPLGAAAAHVTGYVARITPDQLAKLKDQGYSADDYAGQTGLEATYEQQLAGKRGARLAVITADGQVVRQLAQRQGSSPMELVTTLDVKAQQTADALLNNGDHAGSLVMLDPTDGTVLAMVSHPSFDPNWFVQGLTQAQSAQVLDGKRNPLLNRATMATYPPGSTFKVVTASAGLERGGLTLQSTLPCPPVWYGLGQNQPKANWRPDNLGNITVVDALMTSCNPFFYQVGLNLDHIDPNILSSYAASYGYGRTTGINGIDEAAGLDPNPDWKQKTLQQAWFTGDSVNMAIGQGYLLVTPLQVANAFSVIARGGDLRTPLLVRELRPAIAGAAPQEFQSKVIGQVPVSATTLQAIRDGMTRVVQDPRGTAYSVFTGSRLDAAGKSGTAEDQVLQSHVLFVAFAPRTAPKAVAVVVLDNGESGSLEAGPIVRKELEAYLNR